MTTMNARVDCPVCSKTFHVFLPYRIVDGTMEVLPTVHTKVDCPRCESPVKVHILVTISAEP